MDYSVVVTMYSTLYRDFVYERFVSKNIMFMIILMLLVYKPFGGWDFGL